MNERALVAFSGSGFLASVSMAEVSHAVSIAAGLCAVLAAVPVIVDRWPGLITRIKTKFARK